MGSLNEVIKKGIFNRGGDAIVGLILIYFCVMASKVFFLGIGVSMDDYAKYELFYMLFGGLIGVGIAGWIIMGRGIALRGKYSSGSI
jgi:hypothetical protein